MSDWCPDCGDLHGPGECGAPVAGRKTSARARNLTEDADGHIVPQDPGEPFEWVLDFGPAPVRKVDLGDRAIGHVASAIECPVCGDLHPVDGAIHGFPLVVCEKVPVGVAVMGPPARGVRILVPEIKEWPAGPLAARILEEMAAVSEMADRPRNPHALSGRGIMMEEEAEMERAKRQAAAFGGVTVHTDPLTADVVFTIRVSMRDCMAQDWGLGFGSEYRAAMIALSEASDAALRSHQAERAKAAHQRGVRAAVLAAEAVGGLSVVEGAGALSVAEDGRDDS